MAAMAPTTTQGWAALDKDAVHGKMVWQEITLRPFEETDVDIEVTHCGVCGTDTHAMMDTWGMTKYPCCAGHEIVGTVARVGAKVTAFRPGDRVGVGPQGYACLEPDCIACGRGFEMRCPKFVPTHNGVWLDGESVQMGGFAKVHRAHTNVVVKIPDEIPSEYAAPMLCAGITAWSPLKRHGAGPGKSVGVLGVGGIGHFALLWAKALGCDKIVAISRSSTKKRDCLDNLGADSFIAMAEDQDWAAKNAASLDLIISTSDSADMPMPDLLGLLRIDGSFVTAGVSFDPLPGINTFMLCSSMIRIEGSFWGTYREINDMLQFAASSGIRPVIQERRVEEANQVIVDQCAGRAAYKYVLQVQ